MKRIVASLICAIVMIATVCAVALPASAETPIDYGWESVDNVSLLPDIDNECITWDDAQFTGSFINEYGFTITPIPRGLGIESDCYFAFSLNNLWYYISVTNGLEFRRDGYNSDYVDIAINNSSTILRCVLSTGMVQFMVTGNDDLVTTLFEFDPSQFKLYYDVDYFGQISQYASMQSFYNLFGDYDLISSADGYNFQLGFTDGYNKGLAVGEKSGYNDGYVNGLSASTADAYAKGKADALQSIEDGEFGEQFIGDVLSAPLKALNRVVLIQTPSGFDITLGGVVGTAIGVLLFIWFLKMFAGG